MAQSKPGGEAIRCYVIRMDRQALPAAVWVLKAKLGAITAFDDVITIPEDHVKIIGVQQFEAKVKEILGANEIKYGQLSISLELRPPR